MFDEKNHSSPCLDFVCSLTIQRRTFVGREREREMNARHTKLHGTPHHVSDNDDDDSHYARAGGQYPRGSAI